AAPVVYVALGDSTGVGVGARQGGGYAARLLERLERVRAGSRLVNLCVSGATSADVLRGQVGRVGAAAPTLITLGIGINDITHGLAPEEFERNCDEIAARLREQTDAPVVVTNIPDISHAPAVPVSMREGVRTRLNLFNARLAAVASRRRFSLVDAYTKSHALIPAHPEFFSSDNFHPSDEGYEYWAALMWPWLKEAVGEA
ncbi:MAG: SGNH/GDSL hydrolase family protein, partial [Pyrinomonadaceae bacterium]